MIRLSGIFKVASVLTIDFLTVYALFKNLAIAGIVTVAVVLYVGLGGYISLFKEGAVRWDKLPDHESERLFEAKRQLVDDVRRASSVSISSLKLYLIPGDDDMQATAYGANCVSVSRGVIDNIDSMTLCALLGHEVSHTLHYDPEFNRAILATIFLVCGAISVVSFAFIVAIFLIFLIFSLFRSWLGVMAFKGTTKAVRGVFSLLQKGIVVIYQTLASCLSRAAEYRCDLYSASLDCSYGLQLAHFLSYEAPESNRQLSLTEALYRTHPPTLKRVARLEAYVSKNIKLPED